MCLLNSILGRTPMYLYAVTLSGRRKQEVARETRLLKDTCTEEVCPSRALL